MQLALHYADAKSGHIFKAVDFPHAVGQVSESGLPDTQALDTDAGDPLHHLIADIALEYLVGVFRALDHVGKVEYAQLRNKVGQNADIHNGEVQIAQLDSLDAVALIPQLTIIVNRDVIAAVCLFIDKLCKFLAGKAKGAGSRIGGTLGIVIPPSIVFVIYGNITGVNVAQLLASGILPGIIVGVALCIYAYFKAKKNNFPKQDRFSMRLFLLSFKDAIWALIMPTSSWAEFTAGIFTPTESAGSGCLLRCSDLHADLSRSERTRTCMTS